MDGEGVGVEGEVVDRVVVGVKGVGVTWNKEQRNLPKLLFLTFNIFEHTLMNIKN